MKDKFGVPISDTAGTPGKKSIKDNGKTLPAPKAKRITVSVIGEKPLYHVKLHGQEAVDRMIEHWEWAIAPALADKPDLIVVPEACDRFPAHTMAEGKAYYEVRGNQIRDFFMKTAKTNHCYIAYSAARKVDGGTYRNSTQLIDRNGRIVGIYNKNHLVPSETTEGGMLCGKDAPVFKTDFGTVALAICFDLNFQELLGKYAKQRPDLIIFSTLFHGGFMQNYWAYQCRSHLAAAFALGECTVINPVGETVAHSTNYCNRVTTTINLDSKVIHHDGNQEKLLAAKNKYGRGITIFDPGHVGAVLLTSEMADKTVDEIINEFKIETWDEYYDRCIKHRHTSGNMEV